MSTKMTVPQRDVLTRAVRQSSSVRTLLITQHISYIENTILYTELNGQELRLGAVYKSPGTLLFPSDIDLLLDPDVNTILAGDLNAKSTAWHSHSMNTVGRTLQFHMEQNNYTMVAPDTPTHYPDIHHRT